MADVWLTVGLNPKLDFKQFQSEIKAAIAKLETKENAVHISANTEEARARISELRQQISRLRDKTIHINAKIVPTAPNAAVMNVSDLYSQLSKYTSQEISKNITEEAIDKNIAASKEAEAAAQSRAKAEQEASNVVKQAFEEEAAAAKKTAREKEDASKRKQGATYDKQKIAAQKQYQAALKQGESALRSFSSAEKSSNESSRLAYSKLKDNVDNLRSTYAAYTQGSAGANAFQQAVKQVGESVASSSQAIKGNGDATKSWGDRLRGIGESFKSLFTGTSAMMAAIRTVREMVNQSIELDSAMTQMQIVTKASDTQMEGFADSAASAAKRVGTSIKDFTNSATTYARLGYSMEESSQLSEYTAMLQNVGDINVEDASNAVTSIIKAFDIDASQIETVMDKLVTTGNNFPISVEQIAEGMLNASSAMSAAGNSFDESVALMTAANTTLQNASKSSTGLRTISARLRNTKAELDDLGEVMTEAKYEELVGMLTDYNVSLLDEAGAYRSTYDILADLAAQWSDLDSTAKAALATEIAGVRQQTVFYSIMDNFQEAQGAMDAMANSAGALQDAYSIYQDSTQFHIDQLKASFEELSSVAINGDLLKGLLDVGKFFIEAASGALKLVDALGGLKSALVMIGGAIAIIKLDSITKGFSKIAETATKVKDFFSGSISKFKEGWSQAADGANRLSSAFKNMGLSISGAKVGIAAFSIGLTALFAIIDAVKRAQEESHQKIMESADTAAEESNNVLSLYSKYQAANEMYQSNAGAKEGLTAASTALLNALGYEGDQIDQLVAKYGGLDNAINQVTLDALRKESPDLLAGYDEAKDTYLKKARDWWTAPISLSGKKLRDIDIGESDQDIEDRVKEALKNAGFITKSKSWDFVEFDITDEKDALNYYNNLVQARDAIVKELGSSGAQESNAYKNINEELARIKEAYGDVNKYAEEYNKNIAGQKYKEFIDKNGHAPKTKQEFEELKNAMNEATDSGENFVGTQEQIQGAVEGLYNSSGQMKRWYQEDKQEEEKDIDKAAEVEKAFKKVFESASSNSEAQKTFESLSAWYDSLPEGDKELVYNISVNKDTAEWDLKDWQNALGDAQFGFEDLMSEPDNSETGEKSFSTKVSEYIEKMQTLQKAKKKYLSGELTDPSEMFALIKAFPQLEGHTDDLGEAIDNLAYDLTGGQNSAGEFTGIMADLHDALDKVDTEEARNQIYALMEMLQGLHNEVIGSFGVDMEVETNSLNNYYTALKESMSATGLTEDSMDKIKARYSGMNYDASKLFEKTYNGIHLNVSELNRLEKQYIKTNKAANEARYDDLINQRKELTQAIKDAKSEEEKDTLTSQLSSLDSQIEEVALLAAQYDGLTSAYNRWLQAQQTPGENDMYNKIGQGLEQTRQDIENGWWTKDDVREYVQMFTDEDLTNAGIEEIQKVWGGASKSAERYFTADKTTGIYTFLQDALAVSQKLDKTWVKLDKDGNYAFDFGVGGDKEFAKAFSEETGYDIAGETVQAILRAIADAGGQVNLDSLYSSLKNVNNELLVSKTDAKDAASELKKLGKTDIDFDFSFKKGDSDKLNNQLQEAQRVFDTYKNEDGTININAEGYEQAKTMLTYLIQQKHDLEKPAFMKIDTTNVQNASAEVQETAQLIQDLDGLTLNLEIALATGDGGSVSKIQEQITGIVAQLKKVPPKVLTKLGIKNPETFRSQLDSLVKDTEEKTITLPVKPKLQSSGGTKDTGFNSGNGTTQQTGTQPAETSSQTVKVKFEPITEELDTVEAKWKNWTGNAKIVFMPDAGLVLSMRSFFGIPIQQKVIFVPDVSQVQAAASTNYTGKGTVVWGNDTDAVTAFMLANHTANGIINWINDTSYVKTEFHATGYINWTNTTPPVNKGGGTKESLTPSSVKFGGATGTAITNGIAKVQGDWGAKKSGVALMGELGQEMIVRDGRFFTVGDDSAGFFKYKKGDIIFNADQTEQIFKYGKIKTGKKRGSALAEGTAFSSGGFGSSSGGGGGGGGGSTSYTPSSSSSSGSKGKKSTSTKSSDNDNNKNKEDNKEIIDWIAIAIDRIERAIDKASIKATSAFQTLATRLTSTSSEMRDTKTEIRIQEQGRKRYLKQARSVGLNKNLAKKVQNGTININEYNEKTAKQIKDYQEWYEKAKDCSKAIEELKENLAELYKNKFDDVATDYENQLSLIEHLTTTYNNGIDDIETRGYLASTKYYTALQKAENKRLSALKKEQKDLTKRMSDGINSGYIKRGSEAWYEMQQQINGVKESIQESKTALVEFANKIRETKWEQFDYLQERISEITEESDFLIDLMDHSDLYTDNGQLTDTGNATMGLHGQNYNVYMAQADKYAKEIKKLNKEIAKDPNNTILLERRQELLDAQRESILAAEDEKQAIVDMVEEGINLELESLQDLIDKYEESLDSAKDLYDYQSEVDEKSSEISGLRKQLSAYSGDDSEENKAVKQKLEVDLAEAEKDLEETQYDNYISEQKKLLDSLYDEYEMILNERLDNVDALISDMIDKINTNSNTICETLKTQADNVGYTLSNEMKAIWNNEGGAYKIITQYGENFATAFTAVNSVLGSIASRVSAMIGASDKKASSTVSSTTQDTKTNKPSKSSKQPAKQQSKQQSKKQSTKKTIKVGGKINAKGAPIYDYAGDKSGEKQYYAKDPIYTVLKEQKGYLLTRWHKLKSGYTGWFKKSDVKAYKKGGLVDYTGMAQVHGTPKQPEMVLSAKDTSNFISLKDALQKVADGDNLFASLLQNGNVSAGVLDKLAKTDMPVAGNNLNVGDVTYQVNIPIDHVENYEDFMNQMRTDNRFEKFIQSITLDRITGKSKLAKNKYQW